jgi:SAM-dependent methyltransferase
MRIEGASGDITEAIAELSSATWIYTGLSVALELGLAEHLDAPSSARSLADKLELDADLVAELLDVLVALGALDRDGELYSPTSGFEPFRTGSLARVMRAGVRSDQLQSADAFARAQNGSLMPGWSHLDPDLLIAQGETAGLFRLVAEHLLPALDGLGERLGGESCRVLDVGAGVGVLSSELCRVYPELSAVCLEPNPTARAIGRRRCAHDGFDGRIDFRGGRIEELEAEDSFDLALLPQPFLPRAAFEEGLRRVGTALRPGGWLLVLALDGSEADELALAARRVRARLWGGGLIGTAEMTTLLTGAGFASVRAGAPVGAYRTFAARFPGLGSPIADDPPAAAALTA